MSNEKLCIHTGFVTGEIKGLLLGADVTGYATKLETAIQEQYPQAEIDVVWLRASERTWLQRTDVFYGGWHSFPYGVEHEDEIAIAVEEIRNGVIS